MPSEGMRAMRCVRCASAALAVAKDARGVARAGRAGTAMRRASMEEDADTTESFIQQLVSARLRSAGDELRRLILDKEELRGGVFG